MDDETLSYMVAQLIDAFHLSPNEIGKLTRCQITQLYMWPRYESGKLEAPLQPAKPMKRIQSSAKDKRDFVKRMRQLGYLINGDEEKMFPD